MHTKPDLRVFLKWMIARSGSVITDVITLNKTQGTILDMYAPLVTIASLVFCLAGIVLLFLFSVEVFVAWYSGVQHEPPRTQFQILAEGVQMAIVCSATITVFFWWFLPSIRS